MIENNELKINDGNTEKRVNEDVQVGPDDRKSTAEKTRKKISRFYDWFWFVGLLIQLLNIYICCVDFYHGDELKLQTSLIAGIIILATYTFTWMLSKIKRNVFTDFIWTLSYSLIVLYCGIYGHDIMLNENGASCLITFIYWALVWHCTREKSKN